MREPCGCGYFFDKEALGFYGCPNCEGEGASMAIPIEVQIACVKRELAMREHVYPRQIHAEKMTTEKAAAELGAMRGVLETLLAVQAEQRAAEAEPKP